MGIWSAIKSVGRWLPRLIDRSRELREKMVRLSSEVADVVQAVRVAVQELKDVRRELQEIRNELREQPPGPPSVGDQS